MKIAAILLAVLVLASPARADGDHDRARRALEEGRILPLADILARAGQTHPGRLIEAELEDEHGALVYELKLLGANGQVVKLYYDAATGELLKSSSRGRHR
ncbi:PepSY domain-containing protein [Magnetospirillum sp. UT-4]|uniref:PepSY domain-containing protein n=1 Tax=Magnetospirillum sp. UT-4 TaxID=2681467 RepID=UPI00137E2440|nr:PepSY domain-containing protein [Magnetospirillum sp. UT-4]CAA7615101.1 conserved exported hypothetical protein [Magnetospirillum sp. UT-4]